MSKTKIAKASTRSSPRLVVERTKAKEIHPPNSISASSPTFTLWVKHHVYTIWLFSFSDIKTIIVPQTIFALCTGMSQIQKDDHSFFIQRGVILSRTPLVIFWIWINLLSFNISHQRQPDSLKEDAINKPWRPLVTGQWNAHMARNAMVVFYMTALLTSCIIGGVRSSLALILFGYMYNDCGGADKSPIVRNLINALGIISFSTGSLEIALQEELKFELSQFKIPIVPCLENWFMVLFLIIFSTIQFQDMGDIEGDTSHGRQTFPLKYGETLTRRFNCAIVLFWSFWCLWFWESGFWGHVCVVPLGLYTAYSAVVSRTQNQYNNSFRIYNAWTAALYFLPLLQVVV